MEIEKLKSEWVSLSIQIDQAEGIGQKTKLEIALQGVLSQIVAANPSGNVTEELKEMKQAQEQKLDQQANAVKRLS